METVSLTNTVLLCNGVTNEYCFVGLWIIVFTAVILLLNNSFLIGLISPDWLVGNLEDVIQLIGNGIGFGFI